MNAMKAQYFGVTTTGGHWYIVSGPCPTRDDAREQAEQKIGDTRTEYGTDIERETEHENLHVVAKSGLLKFKIGLSAHEEQEYYRSLERI